MAIAQLPTWPTRPVAYGPVVLREFSDADLLMDQELSTDPYVPLIGTLPPNASRQEAQAYIDRQRGRLAEGVGFSFVIAEAGTGRGVGGIGSGDRAVVVGAGEGADEKRLVRHPRGVVCHHCGVAVYPLILPCLNCGYSQFWTGGRDTDSADMLTVLI
jgi:hypothetical protein